MLNLAHILTEAGHLSVLILLESDARYTIPPNIPTHVILPAGCKASAGHLARRQYSKKLGSLIMSIQAETGRFDAIVSSLPLADELCHRARLDNHWCRVANSLSHEIRHASLRKAFTLWLRYRKIYRNKNLICVSEGVASEIQEFLDFSVRTVKVIYNPIDIGEISRKAAIKLEKIPTDPYIICGSRFSPQKRHDLLIKAFENVSRKVKLVMLCDSHPVLEDLVRRSRRKDDIFIAGFQENPYPWLAGAQLSVLCSDYEGMPNILVESLACSTPVVSTDCPHGPREILEKYTPDSLVPVNDDQALANAINSKLKSPKIIVDISYFSKSTALQRLIEIGQLGRKGY